VASPAWLHELIPSAAVAPQSLRSGFRPRATLGLLYLFGFFFLFSFLLAAPTLWQVLQSTPVGPEQEVIAEQAVREVMRSRIGIAFVLAVVATLLGGRTRVLPGTR
jgi:hypothetical protein